MRCSRALAVVFLLTATFATAAPAAVTVYTDRAAFEAAIGPHVTYTFDTDQGFPAAPAPITLAGPAEFSTYTADAGPAYVSIFPLDTDNQVLSGFIVPLGNIRFGTSRLFAAFSTPQYALGFDVFPLETYVLAAVQYGGSTPSEIAYPINTDLDVNFESSTFFGVVSTDPILGFTVNSLADDSRDPTYKGIDNLTIVPEPAALSCCLAPFLFAISGRRRRKVFSATKTLKPAPGIDSNSVRCSYRFASGMELLEARRLLSVSTTFSGTLSLDVGTNLNVSHLTGNQFYANVAVDPLNPSRMFEISNDSAGAEFTAWSDNAGQTWTQSNLMTPGTTHTTDGMAAFDTFGNLFIVYCDQSTNNQQIVTLALSTDGGKTISSRQQLYSGRGDQPTIVTGPGPDSSHESVWVTYGIASDNPFLGHWYTAARGAQINGLGDVGSFGSQQTVPSPHGYENWGDIAIGPSGQVIITYENSTTTTGPENLYTSLDDDGLGPHGFAAEVFVTSTNVGANASIPADPGHLIGSDPSFAWDTNPNSPHYGRLYFLDVDRVSTTTDDTDIYLRHSDDDGATWSTAVRVNDDSSGRSQFFPHVALDYDTGNVGVAWYDCRDDDGTNHDVDQDSTANTGTRLYATVSTDGGDNFLTNKQVGAGTSSNRSGTYPAYGDYIGLAFVGGALFPAWPDNSNSTGDNTFVGPGGQQNYYDVYTARVTLTSTGGQSLAVTGTSSDDQFTVALDPSGTYVQVWESATPAGRPTFTASLAALSSTNPISVDGLTGVDDTLTLLARDGTSVPLALTASTITAGPLTVSHSNLEHRAFDLAAGSYSLATDNGSSWPDLSITASGLTSLTFASTQHLASLTLTDAASAAVADDPGAPNTARVLFAGTLSIDPGASLDIGLSALVADAPDSASLSLLAGYFAGGRITTSASSFVNGFLLGVHGPLDLTTASDHPLGILVSSDQVLFRYTTLGDATGDGVVDLADLNAVLNNSGYSATQLTFHLGDTNDDGVVDLDDLNNVLNNFGNTIFIA